MWVVSPKGLTFSIDFFALFLGYFASIRCVEVMCASNLPGRGESRIESNSSDLNESKDVESF